MRKLKRMRFAKGSYEDYSDKCRLDRRAVRAIERDQLRQVARGGLSWEDLQPIPNRARRLWKGGDKLNQCQAPIDRWIESHVGTPWADIARSLRTMFSGTSFTRREASGVVFDNVDRRKCDPDLTKSDYYIDERGILQAYNPITDSAPNQGRRMTVPKRPHTWPKRSRKWRFTQQGETYVWMREHKTKVPLDKGYSWMARGLLVDEIEHVYVRPLTKQEVEYVHACSNSWHEYKLRHYALN